MAVTAPAFETIAPPATSARRRRYTEDQVPIGRVLLRMLAGLIVLVVFVLPYTIMFFGSVKTKAQIRSVDADLLPDGVALGELHQHVVDARDAAAAEPHLDDRDLGVRDRCSCSRSPCPPRTTRRGSGSPGASCSSSS